MAASMKIPDFDDLPKVEGMPQGTAWGVFDKDGKKDALGTLNLLTPEVVREAYKECKEGISVSLNWPIGGIKTPGFMRKGLVHKTFSFLDAPMEALQAHAFDDEVEFNTQCSSQWDSLIHFHHQPSRSGYNGSKPTIKALEQPHGEWDTGMTLPTLNHWHTRGGMVGRGVLIDHKRWAEDNGTKYSPFDSRRITVDEIEQIAKAQGVEFKFGDIIIIRSGFTEELSGMDGEEQGKALGTHKSAGVDGTVETAKWFWNKHFSAVAGDTIAFEAIPPLMPDGKEGGIPDLVLHQYFLALFGLYIGELWDLKALSETCAKLGRYSFLLTSAPLNVPGLVGSPPNALAAF